MFIIRRYSKYTILKCAVVVFLLTFYLDGVLSVIDGISRGNNERWFQDISIRSIRKCNSMNIEFDPNVLKKKKEENLPGL